MTDQTKNDIGAMRSILFDTLRGIKDGSVEIEKAKAVCETSQTIINSVRAEIDFAKVTGLQPSSDFIPHALPTPPKTPGESMPTPNGTVTRLPGRTVHTMR